MGSTFITRWFLLRPKAVASLFGLPLPLGVWSGFFLYTTLTLLAATISWYAFERPINNLKRHFAYVGVKRPAEPLPATASLQ